MGYRFLAEEWLPDGLTLGESTRFAGVLEQAGVAYISVMGGTYESFFLPEILERSKQEGYMADLAAAVRKVVAVPVIAAGRIATGADGRGDPPDGKGGPDRAGPGVVGRPPSGPGR